MDFRGRLCLFRSLGAFVSKSAFRIVRLIRMVPPGWWDDEDHWVRDKMCLKVGFGGD